ncbi:MAG: dUTP diphosphatase [Patescibacteria group bacterium]
MKVRFIKLNPKASVPIYQSEQAAGADMHACLDEPIVLVSGEHVLVPTGIAVELPEGYELQIRPRSGLALKHGVTVLNSPGTVDSDYRGELMALLVNHGSESFKIKHGERIAQAVIAKHENVFFEEVSEFSKTKRGTLGFGSTGKH